MELKVSEKFYCEKETTPKELADLLKEFDNINLIGKKTIETALAEGLISQKNIIKISGVPHAQIFRF